MNTFTIFGKPSARVIPFPSSGRAAGANVGAASTWIHPATAALVVSELSGAWPFERLNLARIRALSHDELLRLEGGWIFLADQLGLALARPGRCLNGGTMAELRLVPLGPSAADVGDEVEWPFERLDGTRVCLLEPADLLRLEERWILGAQQLGLSLETEMAASPARLVEPSACTEPEHFWWGEIIYGTRAHIQRFGIAEGCAFPGEVGGPRRRLNVKDPRGFDTRIEIHRGIEGRRDANGFVASISYPARDIAAPEWQDVYSGVRCRAVDWFDEFVGTAQALVAAGLLSEGQFPGLAGMRRVRVRIAPDGAVIDGPPTRVDARTKLPGSKCVEKAGASAWRVRVYVSDEVAKRRREVSDATEWAAVAAFKRMPRPAPLVCASHLRLV
jgi:hypothetical protein